MSKITIEAIDQVMERVPGATYAEVREALIKSDGDVIDAIILLQENSTEKENKNKKTFEEVFGKDSDKIKEEITELLRKSNVIRIVIEKNGIQCNCGKRGCFETYCSIKRLKNMTQTNMIWSCAAEETERWMKLLRG